MWEYDDFRTHPRRETVRIEVPQRLSKLIEELVKGRMIETRNGGITRSLGLQLKQLREDGTLRIAHDPRDGTSYVWLENIPRAWEKKRRGFGGTIWYLIFGSSKRKMEKKRR